MNENLNTESENTKAEQSKAAVKKDALGLWSSLKIFLIEKHINRSQWEMAKNLL